MRRQTPTQHGQVHTQLVLHSVTLHGVGRRASGWGLVMQLYQYVSGGMCHLDNTMTQLVALLATVNNCMCVRNGKINTCRKAMYIQFTSTTFYTRSIGFPPPLHTPLLHPHPPPTLLYPPTFTLTHTHTC